MNENFRGKGRPPATNFGIRKLESLGYRMVKKIAENFSRLNRAHQRHRQTSDYRQTTDGRPIAYSERNVVRSLKIMMCSVFSGLAVLAYCLGRLP